MIKKKIVILGGGYGGIAAAKRLISLIKSSDPVEILLIEKNPYHTLMTQLHETAGGRTHSMATRISYEQIFRKVKNVEMRVICDTIEKVDFHNNVLKSADNCYPYDYLAVATGSRPEFFNIEGAEQYAFKLWSYKEAVVIREHMGDCFLLASKERSAEKRRRLLSFVIAGGGFTGVEIAGELASFTRRLSRKYEIPYREVSISLVEAAPSILTTLPEKSVATAVKYLEKMGVSIFCNAGIEKVEQEQIYLNTGRCLDGTLIWSAGIKGNPCVQGSGLNTDNRVRVETDAYLRAVSVENVYCIGDAISYIYQDRRMPQVVENARQSGQLAAENLYADMKGRDRKKYEPRFHGSMLSIGPFYGIARVGKMNLRWCFGTALKHLVNLHYHWSLGGLALAGQYLKWQFSEPVRALLFSSDEELEKQVTQFF